MMRPIDASRFAKETVPTSFGPAAQLQWLPIASLVVDETYQRPLAQQGERTVRTIIAKFDWRMFAPVVVSPIPGGQYAIVDGQHRTTAAAVAVLADHPHWSDDRRLATAFEQIDLEEAWRKSNAAAAARRGVVSGDVLQAEIISHLLRTYGARAAA